MIHVGSVYCRVTAAGPAGAERDPATVFDIADEECPARALALGMAFEAEIGVPIDQELLIDRPVR